MSFVIDDLFGGSFLTALIMSYLDIMFFRHHNKTYSFRQPTAVLICKSLKFVCLSMFQAFRNICKIFSKELPSFLFSLIVWLFSAIIILLVLVFSVQNGFVVFQNHLFSVTCELLTQRTFSCSMSTIETCFTFFSIVSFVDFEQVSVSWEDC